MLLLRLFIPEYRGFFFVNYSYFLNGETLRYKSE